MSNKSLLEAIESDLYQIIDDYLNEMQSAINEDIDDHTHNAAASKIKKSFTRYLNNTHKGRATFFAKSVRDEKGSLRDISVHHNLGRNAYKAGDFGVTVLYRKAGSDDTFRLQINRQKLNYITAPDIDYFAFATCIEPAKYKYYVVKAEDVRKLYEKRMATYERCKAEVKAKVRDKKTLDFNKLKDNYGNRIAPMTNGEGLVLTDKWLEKFAVDIVEQWVY